MPCRAVPCRASPRLATRDARPFREPPQMQNLGLDPSPASTWLTRSPPRKRSLEWISHPSLIHTLQDSDGAIMLSFPPGESPIAIPREVIAIQAGVAVVSALVPVITGSAHSITGMHARLHEPHPSSPVTQADLKDFP